MRKSTVWKSVSTLAAGALISLAADVSAAPLLTLAVQPIQLCNDDGTSCANSGRELFTAETNKIWSQADIRIDFLPWSVQNSTFLNQTDASDAFGDYASSGDAKILNIYFATYMQDCGGTFPTGLYGCGTLGGTGGRIVINDLVFSFNNNVGRLDTIAHEIGHTLGGLGHDTYGAGGALNLMSSGSVRTIPGSINDIYPDGLDTDQLTQQQIDQARSSDRLAVPEPATLALIIPGLIAIGLRRRIQISGRQ